MRKRFNGIETSAVTRSWLLNTFALGTANYWMAFLADFSTGVFFIAWDAAHGVSPLAVAGAFGIGFLLWGLTEYAFHRWIYHQPKGIFGEGHRIHHAKAETLIAMPWFITTSVMFMIWYLVSLRLGVQAFATVVAGWLLGFVWYSLVHHSHHHWDIRNGWVRKLKAYHRIHHHFPDQNYGVTMRFWDFVFGTVYRKPVADQPESAAAASQRDSALIDA